MYEKLIERLVVEIEKSCADNCPCSGHCTAHNDEECFSVIRTWLASDESAEVVAGWISYGLGTWKYSED